MERAGLKVVLLSNEPYKGRFLRDGEGETNDTDSIDTIGFLRACHIFRSWLRAPWYPSRMARGLTFVEAICLVDDIGWPFASNEYRIAEERRAGIVELPANAGCDDISTCFTI